MKRTAILLVTLLGPGVLQAAKIPVAGRVAEAPGPSSPGRVVVRMGEEGLG